jgi:molybdopterin synthase sulfur carrier subunit
MKIKVLYLASLREQLGKSGEDLEIPPATSTVAGLRTLLMARGGAWQAALAQGRALRVAVNQEMAQPTTAVQSGDEIAFFPPVTGG